MSICYCNITYQCNNSCLFCAANNMSDTPSNIIPLSKFKEILEKCQVNDSDIVVLNGGEPTLHPDFFDFCNEISARGAKIDLFTNGKKLADANFVERLLTIPTPMIVRIPIFGRTPETHDRLTGVSGNFSKLCMAINNLYESTKKDLQVDIKLLLSKVTVPENIGIFERFRTKLNDKRFLLTLNHLLISQSVISHKDIFFMPYSELIDASLELFKKLQSSGISYRINMPICLLPPEFRRPRKVTVNATNTSSWHYYYSDPKVSCRDLPKQLNPACSSCVYNNMCSFFPDSYLAFYGTSEISPIS